MSIIKEVIFKFDQSFLNITKKYNTNKHGLVFLLFHSVFKDKAEMEKNHIDKQWGFTLDEYRYIFDKFLENDYTFISHKDLLNLNHLNSNKKFIYLHFDDGYFNNINLIPLLEEYKIHANFLLLQKILLIMKNFGGIFYFINFNLKIQIIIMK